MPTTARLVLSMATELASLADPDVDKSIERALGLVGTLVGADRCYVFLPSQDGRTVSNTHEWCAAGIEPARDALQALPLDAFPWAFQLLRGLDEVHVPRVADVPPSPERTEWEREGIQALHCTPIRVQGAPVGFLGCDWVRRADALEEEFVQTLRVAAVLIAGALERRHAWRIEEQLRQSQKMQVVGQLAGGVAHDFNNLLLAINVSADIATRSLPPEAVTARRAIDDIRDAADRAATLTRQLLTFSRRRPMQVRSFDVNALAEEMLRMIRRIVPESIEIDFRPGAVVPTLQADASQIEQVLLNLCVNAADAMPSGGQIVVETSAVARPDGSMWLQIAVRDTGRGMPPEVRERIFEPFFTTKPPGRGSGLGLAIVYGIVQQHGGSIDLTTAPGAGTTFVIALPIVSAAAPASPHAATTRAVGGRETILLAEDDPHVRRLLTTLLSVAGYTVLDAADGEEAVVLFRARAREIDLVILDAVMPRRSGLEAYLEIARERPEVPVLFSSGYSSTVFPEGFFDQGGHHLIEKPYDSATLLARVRALLDAPLRRS